MNLERNLLNIIVCSVSFSFFISMVIVPWTKDLIVRLVWQYNNYLYFSKKIEDYSLTNNVRRALNKMKLKPFSCMGCMSFWCSLSSAIYVGYGLQSAIVGIIGYFFGTISESIIKRFI